MGKEKTITLPVGSLPSGGGVVTNQNFSADFHMHDVTFNAVLKPRMTTGRAAPYAIVGPGVYHRTVNVTTPAVGYTTVCDPFWYVCYPVAVSVDKILGTRSSTDFGMNFGGGASFKINDRASVYFEVRYLYIWGPTFDIPAVGTTAAKSVRANGQAVPFVFGVRF